MAESKFVGPLGKKEKNIRKLRDAGYSDAEIVDTIIKSREVAPGKLEKMRKSGVTDEGILHFLLTGKDLPLPDPVKTFQRGMAVGGSQLLGAPSDIVEGTVNAIERRADEVPAFNDGSDAELDVPLGSDFFKRQANKIGGDNFAYDSLSDLPTADRPVAAAGEVLGGNIAVGGALYGASKAGMLGKVGEVIRKNPKTVAAVESGSTVGAMQGAALGEAVDPGGYGRIVGEIGGGFVNPLGVLYRYSAKTVNAGRNWIQTLTPSGRYDRAAVMIRGALEEAGENPGDIAKALRKRGVTANQTAGMKTGSPTLLALEQKLRRESASFGREYAEKMDAATEDIKMLIAALSSSESPEALKAAAQVRAGYIDSVIEARLTLVKNKATEARAKFPDARDMGTPSAEAYKVLEDALTDARKIETSEYWSKVDKTVPVEDVSGITSGFEELQAGRLKVEADSLPPLIRQQIRRVKLLSGDLLDEAAQAELAKGPLTSGELITFRSRMLAEARKARGAQDWDTARIYETMGESVLDDLEKLNAPGYKEARDFSRRLHEKFSQTFAGTALSVSKQGGDRISPTLVLQRAFGSGGERGALQMGELEDAARFSNKSMMEHQEDFLRAAATASRKDGVFNPQSLGAFLDKNKATLDRFPNLKNDLMDVKRAESVLSSVEKKIKPSFRMRQRAALEQVIEAEDSAKAVGSIFAGATPQKDYLNLVKTAKNAGSGAVGGLRAATMDYAFNRALRPDQSLDITKFKNSLFSPVSSRGPSPVEMMLRNGVMTKRQEVQLRRLINSAEKIQQNIDTGAQLGAALETEGLFDLVVRVTGARIGAKLGEGGSSLLAASRGSEYARKLFEKVPANRMRDVFIEASDNPQIMAMLLERKPSPKRKVEIANRIRAWLVSSGLTAPQKLTTTEQEPQQERQDSRLTPLPLMP